MPVLTRECLALKLRQNWLAKHPQDTAGAPGAPLDDSLTSLNWLQNLNIMKITTPTPPSSPTPDDGLGPMLPQYTPQTQVNPNAVLNMGNVVIKEEPMSPGSPGAAGLYRLPNPMMDVAPPLSTNPNVLHEKIDYKTNPYVKPPYSYATLICMAMKETKKNKITLAGIYNWITDNFMYYRHADPSWQNSIRHNLSLNKCFQKVPRRKDEPGKGGFWRINPEYEDMFINGIFKKRRAANTPPTTLPPLKKLKSDDGTNSCCSSEDSNGASDTSPMLNCTLGLTIPKSTSIEIKKEPRDHMFPTPPTDHIGDFDFNWNSLLTQDIDVGGVKIKTEDLLDSNDDSDIASPITTLSPPPSDSNSDVAIEDLLNNTDVIAEFENPTDFDNGEPLDLSISGISLRPPEWWSDSINDTKGFFSPTHVVDESASGGLHTPRVLSPSGQHCGSLPAHPWAEDHKSSLLDGLSAFDTDIENLFDIDSMPSPR